MYPSPQMVRRALDSSKLFPMLFGLPQALRLDDVGAAAAAGVEVPEWKWIHVASTGLYRGHWQGEFDLTRETFESFVKNLRAHPQYKIGDVPVDGKTIQAGSKPTIQYDYEHCSEMPATEGTIPRLGAEAPAWVTDLDIRPGDGCDQLWALSWLGAQIRDQIKRNAYRQTSIAFDLESKDWKTGQPAGPALTSIAFTNHPFLKQLESYAAANRRGTHAATSTPETPAPTPGPATPEPTPPPQRTEPMNAPAASTTDYKLALDTFKANVCLKLGIRVLQDTAAVEDAVGQTAASGSKLSALLTALGVNDAESGLKVIPEFRGAREQLSAALQELDEMLSGQAAMDDQIATADVNAVMSALKFPDDAAHREPLMAYRKQCMDAAVTEFSTAYRRRLSDDKARVPVTKIIEFRSEGRAKFLKTYGITEGVDTSNLGKTLAASKGGKQHAPPTPPVLPLSTSGAGDGAKQTVDLRNSPGVNPTDKVIKHLTGTDPTFKALSHYEKCKRATAFSEQNEVLA